MQKLKRNPANEEEKKCAPEMVTEGNDEDLDQRPRKSFEEDLISHQINATKKLVPSAFADALAIAVTNLDRILRNRKREPHLK